MNNNYYYRTQQPQTQLDMLRQQGQMNGMNQQNMNGQPYYQQGQNVYYQPQGQQVQNQQFMNQQGQAASQGPEMIWVQGEVGAKAYMVAPGCTIILWDSEQPIFYIKSADLRGAPSMQIFDYSERQMNTMPQSGSVDTTKFVTRDEFNAVFNRLQSLESTITQPLTGTGTGGEITNAEPTV